MADDDTNPQVTADGLVILRADAAMSGAAGVHDPHAAWFVTEAGRRLAAMALSVDPIYAVYNLARFRHFSERLVEAGRTFEQIVLLGSGYDTRPWWLPGLADGRARIIEVDVPATLAAKGAVLAAHGVATPAALTSVGADLDTADLPTLLAGAGWRAGRPTFVLIEGVFYYLRPETVRHLLSPAALGLTPDSVVAFDWWDDARTDRLNGAVAARGGPRLFNSFPLPQSAGALGRALQERGFTVMRDTPLDAVAREIWPMPHDWDADLGWRITEASVAGNAQTT